MGVPPVVGEQRVNILGVAVSAINMPGAVSATENFLAGEERSYVCITGVHGIIEAQDDAGLRETLNGSFLTTPDGMPTVWLGRHHGFSEMTRVYGPDYMVAMCEVSASRGYRHFLYGGKPGVAEQLRDELVRRFPGLQIVGTYTPPFRLLNPVEEAELERQLDALDVDMLWCGLSTPKQERFMQLYVHRLPVKLMVGVGAAFDLLTGNVRETPDWMKKRGLQWLYRLIQEPRRLWRRYLFSNPRFMWLTFLQLTKLKRFPLSSSMAGRSRPGGVESKSF